MAALPYNLRIQHGETYRKVIRWLDAEGKPKIIEGWTAIAQIKSAYGAEDVIMELSTDSKNIELRDGGYVLIYISDEQTWDLPVAYKSPALGTATYYYDLFLYAPNGDTRRFMEGLVIVKGSITHVR